MSFSGKEQPMTAEEEEAISSVLDNSAIHDAVIDIISLIDIGWEQGFIDGFAGKPVRDHPKGVPELFVFKYKQGYEYGVRELADKKVCREIARHEQRLGRNQEVQQQSEPEQVKSVNTPDQEAKNQDGFIKKYGATIVGTVISGVTFGLLGMYVGKVQERKRCMDVKRDMGVPEK